MKQSGQHYLPHRIIEKQLNEAREKIELLSFRGLLYETMNDASIDRIMALDTDLNIIGWNKRSEQVTGLSKEAVIGEAYFEIFPEMADHQPTINAINQALKGRTVFLGSDKTTPGDGHHENHYIPLRDDHDQVIGVMNIKHDVGHRIKAENELRSLNRALARKNRELKQRNEELLSFTHITSHDLKEPLRKIYTFVEMIATQESTGLSDKAKQYFKRIQAAVQRMGMLTDDVLAIAALSKSQAAPSEVELDHILRFVKEMLHDELQNTGTILRSSQLPVVRGYRQLLSRLFSHLLSNCIKFRKQETAPEIDISWTMVPGTELKHPDASAETEYYRIDVTDNGIGFDKNYKDRIFQMFQKLNKEDYPGTGIGLALCRKIAAIHQGFITASSVEGQGSTFTVYLPSNGTK